LNSLQAARCCEAIERPDQVIAFARVLLLARAMALLDHYKSIRLGQARTTAF